MDGLYEMLPQQKKIWEVQTAYPGTDVCNIGGYLHLEGKYDVLLLQKTIELFLRNNSSFWIKVNSQGKIFWDPIQTYAMKEYDFTNLAAEEIHDRIQGWICEPFSIYDSYLFDFRLLRLQGKILIFEKFHHLIADGYTVALCARRQEQIYEQLLAGKADVKTDTRYQEEISLTRTSGLQNGGKKSDWEDRHLSSVAKRALNPAAEIFSGWLTESEESLAGVSWPERNFSYGQIRKFCRTYRVSVEALFYGCLAMYLCRVTDGDGLAVGRDLLSRKGDEFTVTGMKVHTRTFVAEPKWESSAADFLADLKRKLAKHTTEQKSCPVLPEIEISYRPTRCLPSPAHGECREFYSSSSETPVKIFINEERDGVELVIKYQKEAISGQRIKSILSGALFLMEQILNDPTIPCGRLSLLREEEKQKIKTAQQGGGWQFQSALPERFLAMADRYPQRPAVFWRGNAYSYGDFLKLVRQMMRVISKRADWSRQRVIGLCLTRTPYLPAAVYASWLSGCAFLPISPKESKERREKISGHCALCLTDAMLKEEKKEETDVSYDIRPDIPAYEIYTSGTTGEPKAVRISHSSVSCRLEWMMDVFWDGAQTILQKTKSTFDVSVWELTMPFAFGKSLYLLEDGKEADPKAIADALVFGGVTMAHFVPSMLERFLDYLERENRRFPDLKYLILSGEEPGAELVKKAYELLSDTQIYNLYGPAECTIDVSFYHCTGREKRIALGRPVYATRLSVRNKRGEILPVGERGELVIEGGLVGLGYNGKEETSGFFTLDGKRAYRTGDLAVLSEDGMLYYEGREDCQVKIRGMRINLSEVERNLNDAVSGVHCRVLQIGSKLVAFCQGEGSKECLKEEAAKRLPYYCIPSEFLFVNELPVRGSGKADKKELEKMYRSRCRKHTDSIVFSRDWEVSRREKTLLLLARKHLKRNDITLDQSLLDFGMDSLTALSFLAECAECGIFVSYEAIYKKPYLRELAKEEASKEETLVFLQKKESRRLLLAIPFAGGTPLSIFPLARQLAKEELDVAAFHPKAFRGQSIADIAREIAASKQIKAYDQIYVLGACAGSVCAIQTASLLGERLFGLMLCEALPNRVCIWDSVPDGVLANLLQRLRGRSFEVKSELLQRFREDVKRSARHLRQMKPVSIGGKTVLVFGEKDAVTFGCQTRAKLWHRWIQGPFSIYRICGARHFLTEDHPELVAKIIRKEFLKQKRQKKDAERKGN